MCYYYYTLTVAFLFYTYHFTELGQLPLHSVHWPAAHAIVIPVYPCSHLVYVLKITSGNSPLVVVHLWANIHVSWWTLLPPHFCFPSLQSACLLLDTHLSMPKQRCSTSGSGPCSGCWPELRCDSCAAISILFWGWPDPFWECVTRTGGGVFDEENPTRGFGSGWDCIDHVPQSQSAWSQTV